MLPLEIMKAEWYSCEIFSLTNTVKIEDDPNFVPGTKLVYYSNFLNYLFYLFKNRDAVMYSNSLVLRSLIVWIIWKKTFFYSHAYLFWSTKLKKAVIGFFYRYFTKVRCNNWEEKRLLDSIKPGLWFVAPLALSDFFYEKKFSGAKNSGIFIGNLTDIKNPRYLLEALKILKGQHIACTIHIVWEDRSNFQETVQALWLGDMLVLHGAQTPSQITEIFQQTSFYINTSHSEWQCLAAYEAALAWKILILPQGNISFFPVFWENAYYHNSAEELANIMINIILKQDWEKEKLLKNQQMILEDYSFSQVSLLLKKLLVTVTDDSPRDI